MSKPIKNGEILPDDGQVISRSDKDTLAHAARLAKVFPQALILLQGPFGAGKTTWTRGFAAGLGIDDNVSSPTYTILNVYRRGDRTLYHLDLYRLGCLEEVYDVGLFEILDAGFPCVVEWSERVPELAGWPHLEVILAPSKCPSGSDDDTNCRSIKWTLRKGGACP
ncbi:MAG: tRNA (adenosine(37)-N6)-threonylcarbamoyltransferase complex ATPase subunit type 1 TsaE [Candidatus Riflebacteria bacterium]|nr:tRNA (adenosine(37)-N6)-threonylcarbamoyltransferase complex ATPase subunit type 1 TsaE [Candidatus Riflebacteria bacterium]